MSELDEGAQAIGAANTLVRTENGYKGYNTDMLGLLREVRSYGVELDAHDVIILGAGGAAKAVAYMCGANGAGHVYGVRVDKNSVRRWRGQSSQSRS